MNPDLLCAVCKKSHPMVMPVSACPFLENNRLVPHRIIEAMTIEQ